MNNAGPLTLVNPQNGNLAFRLWSFEDNSLFDHIQRLNYYSIILVNKGIGNLKADFSSYPLNDMSLMCFAPFQPFMITAEKPFSGIMISFHPDFFCIHKHQKEVACNGVLFNNIYEPPVITILEKEFDALLSIYEQMKVEMQNAALAQYELLVSYLKILLINASRLKVSRDLKATAVLTELKEPFILHTLKNAIEDNYKTKHAPAEYADILNISSKALAKITKIHFNKTLTDLIAERIVIEAKRELYLTSKPVKSIAYELGFNDEYYFSRFFKKNAEVSPQLFRDTVGYGRADN